MLRKLRCGRHAVSAVFARRFRRFSTAAQENEISESEQTEVVWPEIHDETFDGKMYSKYEESCNAIRKLPTVEEKLFKVNMPRYYGWRPIIFQEGILHYNVLPCAQAMTKTHLVRERGLPGCYDHMMDPGSLNQMVADIRNDIEEVLVLETSGRRRDNLDGKIRENPIELSQVLTNSLIQQINRVIMNKLAKNYEHILDSEVDHEPRLEAFWVMGGVPPPEHLVKYRSKGWQKIFAHKPIDLYIQYKGCPSVQVRNCHPLREIMSIEEAEDTTLEVPDWRFNPGVLGYQTERRHVTNIPAFWPGDRSEFGLISYNHRAFSQLMDRQMDDYQEALDAHAILASFATLMTQACYQGFSPFNDITYPFVHQMISTNGQKWSFYVYQMNTVTFSSFIKEPSTKRNICWGTEEMYLYNKIEDGKVHGLNDEVIKHLLKFYLNVPEQRDYDMKPYLGETVKAIADYDEDEKRIWLEKHFKHLMSCRSRHRAMPEILQWQKIYMIQNKTRPLEKKREPWEFGINPYRRRLDDHAPRYIPKALRPNPKKKYKWEKWEKTYYP